MRIMELEVHSTSESGYGLKRETQHTQTDFSTRDVAIQADGLKTCEIGVQTCDRHIPVWLKVCIGVVGSLACLLVLYYITSSISHYKMIIVQVEEKNKNLTDQLQSLTNEHEILKNQLEQKNITHNQLEISLDACKEDCIKYTNTDLNNKLKLCKIQHKDLEDQITKCKTVARYKGNETINLNTTSCKDEQKKLYDEVLLQMNEREGKISVLEKEITKLSLDNDDLKTSKEKCETSISEVMAVTGTRDNVKLTKMEDFSHEKLAEEFREIYDEEYSDADDELRKLEKYTKNGSSEKYLLGIVKMAYELCSTYAIEHKRSIKESITNIDVKTSSHSKRLGDRKESVRRVSIEDVMSAFEMDNIANLTLSTAIRIQQPIIQVLSEIIASEFEIETENQPNLMSYVRKCLELCWMMNMHSHPIVVKFEDTTDPVIFDRKTYKTYENDGEFLDFVVWPPVYVYEGGKLISKGIAEGKDN